jgi:hypothetical protein
MLTRGFPTLFASRAPSRRAPGAGRKRARCGRTLNFDSFEPRTLLSSLPGAIFTTTSDGSAVDANIYDTKDAVYLNGGPNSRGHLPAGDYYFQVTDPSGKTLLSTDAIGEREVEIDSSGFIDAYLGSTHTTGVDLGTGAVTVGLMPYGDTPNNGGEYKVWLTPVGSYDPTGTHGSFGFVPGSTKTDNFKVKTTTPPTTQGTIIATDANPKSVTLGTSTVTLNDSASLVQTGTNSAVPGGTITFDLFDPNGTLVYTDTVSVDHFSATDTTYDYDTSTGDNPGGYTLPTSSAVTGTYEWAVSYSGDTSYTSSDSAPNSEPVVVSPATPSLVTTATPHGTITLSTTAPTLTDSAVLSNGYNPTGTITFTLAYNGTTVYTDVVTIGVNSGGVTGNGTYDTSMGNHPGGYTLPTNQAVTGAYVWKAVYSDTLSPPNNTTASDPGTSALEQVTVNPATPSVVTTANPTGTIYAGTTAPTLKDSAVLSNGYYPTGNIVFTLTGPGGYSYSQTVAVSGNGTYTASNPADETATGTYTWTAVYTDNLNPPNNTTAHDQGGSAEQVTLAGDQVVHNEAAPMGFWANNNGQKLLKTYTTTGANSIGTWLGTTYPNLFGNLNGATGTQVAAYFLKVKAAASGSIYNTYAQSLTTALSVWVTTTGLGWNTTSTGPTHYGFQQGFGGLGLGDIYYNVGNNGASFGVANNTFMKVSELLAYFNSQCVRTGGNYTTLPTFVFYGNNSTTLLNGANNVFNGINNTGDIV